MSKTKTKQFKIGEYAIGGIIKVDITKEESDRSLIEVKALDWNTKRILMADWAETDHVKWYNQILNTLNEMTSSYHADRVMSYIKEQVNKLECA
jgi:hypothetical protein